MRKSSNQPARFIRARHANVCPETGRQIQAGEECAYYPATGQAFHSDSKAAEEVRGQAFAKSWGMADANY